MNDDEWAIKIKEHSKRKIILVVSREYPYRGDC